MLLIFVSAVSLTIAFLQKFNQSYNNHDGEQVTSVRNHGINYHAALIYVLNGEGKCLKLFLYDAVIKNQVLINFFQKAIGVYGRSYLSESCRGAGAWLLWF